MSMVTLEDYELAYMLYNEGTIFESTCDSLELKALTESPEYIEESLKDNLTKYVNMIVTNVQNVWNQFQANISKSNLAKNEKAIVSAINDYKPNIDVESYVNYDTAVLTNFHLNSLEYTTMKESLDDVSSFLTRYYANIYKDNTKSFKDNLKTAVVRNKEDKHKISKDDLNMMYSYMKDYTDKIVKDINADVQKLNDSVKNSQHINFVVNSTPTPGTGQTSQNASAMIYMVEDTGDNKISTGNSDNPGQNTSNDDAEKQKSNEEAEGVKRVQNYFKAATQIISAKMSVSREVYNAYNKFVMKHVKDVEDIKKKFDEDKKKKEETNKQSGRQVNQVQTNV